MIVRLSAIVFLTFTLAASPAQAGPALPGTSDGGVWLVPASPTTVSFAGKDGGSGLLMYPLGGGPAVMTFIPPWGVPGGNLLSTWEDGFPNVALFSNTLYHVYVFDTDDPKLDFSQTGPNVNLEGITTKTGDNTRRYVGVLYTLDTGPGIDVSFSGSTGPLRAVVHSEFNSQPLMLQTGEVGASIQGGSIPVDLGPQLTAHVVMRATEGFVYNVSGYASAQPTQTLVVQAKNATNGDIKQRSVVTSPEGGSVTKWMSVTSTYGQALATGYYKMITEVHVSGGVGIFNLSASLWVYL